MNNAEKSPAARMGELIAQAAKIGVLKKVVFSKSDDPSILRTVITLRTVGGRVVAQAETLRTDADEFCLSFDHRNAGKPISDGAKSAIERTLVFINGTERNR